MYLRAGRKKQTQTEAIFTYIAFHFSHFWRVELHRLCQIFDVVGRLRLGPELEPERLDLLELVEDPLAGLGGPQHIQVGGDGLQHLVYVGLAGFSQADVDGKHRVTLEHPKFQD